MGIIYLDQNYISNVGFHTQSADAVEERQIAQAVVQKGDHRFAVSAWNMYETARAPRPETREGCIAYVEAVRPQMCANPRFVQVQELVLYLAARFNPIPYRIEQPSPFCETPARMWATYGGLDQEASLFVGETFRDGVEMLTQKKYMTHLDAEIDDGPRAALVARQAYRDGKIERDTQIIDRDWLLTLLPERNPATGAWIDVRQREAIVDYLMEHMNEAYQTCPAAHAEEQTFRHRAASDSKLKRSDGVDVQFVVLAVAYCDYLVTEDGALRELIENVAPKVDSRCRVIARLAEL